MSDNKKLDELLQLKMLLETDNIIEVSLIKKKEIIPKDIVNIKPFSIQPLMIKSDYHSLPNLPSSQKFLAQQWNIQVNNLNYLDNLLLWIFETSSNIDKLIFDINATYLRQLATTK